MNIKAHYGRTLLTRLNTKMLQLEWEMVEQPAGLRRFLDFPCTISPAFPRVKRFARRRTEKRALAA